MEAIHILYVQTQSSASSKHTITFKFILRKSIFEPRKQQHFKILFAQEQQMCSGTSQHPSVKYREICSTASMPHNKLQSLNDRNLFYLKMEP